MSLYTFAPPSAVAQRIKDGRINQDWAVVDVRDSDYIGGHIPGCHHVPFATFNENVLRLIDELKDIKCVIFHCALSQQRGPTAAKLYANVREDKLMNGKLDSSLPFGDEARARGEAQEVIVVEGGFKRWIQEFKDDPSLVEGYISQFW